MLSRPTVLAAALAASPALWAATSNVDAYGAISTPPTSGVLSAAADIGTNFLSPTPFTPAISVTETPGQMAAIALPNYTSQAKTTLGSNHAFAGASGFNNGAFGAGSFSGWYDQVTITGGTGTGTVQFSVQLNGTVTTGTYLGAAGFGLLASSVHPSQLTSDTLDFGAQDASLWALDSDQVSDIVFYDVVASPYNNLPYPFGDNSGTGFSEYVPDLVLTPGANQAVNVTLTGTLTFTYGEAFYLIGALGTSIVDISALGSFESFDLSETPMVLAPPDGTGPTTLDFFNSAHLASVVLPQGASFSSASGTAYNVTAVPEPGEWLMLLAGLGLVGWRVRRKAH